MGISIENDQNSVGNRINILDRLVCCSRHRPSVLEERADGREGGRGAAPSEMEAEIAVTTQQWTK